MEIVNKTQEGLCRLLKVGNHPTDEASGASTVQRLYGNHLRMVSKKKIEGTH